MHLLALTHVPYEGPAALTDWAAARGHPIECWPLYEKDRCPDHLPAGLIILGGPMNIYEEQTHPWLVSEKAFIRQAIEERIPVLGICLGAQLIAEALGVRITRNPDVEIGWWHVTWSIGAHTPWRSESLEESPLVFHWHADTFALPSGCERIASSPACLEQGFSLEDRVLALQFHMESTPESVAQLIEHGGHSLVKAPYVQSAEEMAHKDSAVYQAMHRQLFGMLDRLFTP